MADEVNSKPVVVKLDLYDILTSHKRGKMTYDDVIREMASFYESESEHGRKVKAERESCSPH